MINGATNNIVRYCTLKGSAIRHRFGNIVNCRFHRYIRE